jgi:hypothetical protein
MSEATDASTPAPCACGDRWQVFLATAYISGEGTGDPLAGAEVTSLLDFITLDFEKAFVQPGQGSVSFYRSGTFGSPASSTLSQQYISMYEMYPHRAMVFVQRLAGPGASPTAPKVEFAGLVETVDIAINGVVTLGFTEITKYLDYRVMYASNVEENWVFNNVEQTVIAADLVNLPNFEADPAYGPSGIGNQGVPLWGVANPNLGVPRDRTYLGSDFKNLGEAVTQLTQVINGPVYELNVYRNALGRFRSEMVFSDALEVEDIAFINAADVVDYTLTLDGNEHATRVIGTGAQVSGDSDVPLIAEENLDPVGFPGYDASPSWTDVSDLSTLQEHVEGYSVDHHDLTGSCSIVLAGVEHTGMNYLRPGYPIEIFIQGTDLTFVSIEGNTTIDSVSVSVSAESETVTVACSAVNLYDSTVTAEEQFPPTGCVEC